MNYRNSTAFLLIVCAWCAAPLLFAADPSRPSHKPIGPEFTLDDNDLAARLQPGKDMAAYRALAERVLKDPNNYNFKPNEALRKRFEKELKDPDLRKLLEDKDFQKVLRDATKNPKVSEKQLDELRNNIDKIPPEKLTELAGNSKLNQQERDEFTALARQVQAGLKQGDDKRLQELINKLGENPNVPTEHLESLQRLAPLAPDDPKVTENPQGSNTNDKPTTDDQNKDQNPGTGETPDTDPNDWIVDQAATILEKIDPNDVLLEKVVDLLTANPDNKEHGLLQGMLGKGLDLIGKIHDHDWRPSEETKETAHSVFDKFRTPSLPKSDSNSASPSKGSGFPSPGTMDMEQLAKVFVWGAVLAILGVAGWRLLVWYRAMEGRGGLPRRWPVLPGAVATRGDLVRAFEYLALLTLGVEAKHRHHLDLAARLGGAVPELGDGRREAANHLAHLYELARYAPADEPLPESELAAARRDLSYLAGAAAA